MTATATGSNTKTRSSADTIKINPALNAAATVQSRTYEGATVNVTTTGGSGKLIGAVWTCQDGGKVSGPTATCASKDAGTATVTAADGAGNTATASVAIAAAPPKPACKQPGSIKAGKARRVKLRMKVTKKAARKTKVKIEVTASKTKKVTRTVTCKAKAGKTGSAK
ncbi:MAG: hypothetical protein JJE13_09520 [Thermoleophilia bacterium]|nr:hypothetical protein [Thermoleophilia bacterium]